MYFIIVCYEIVTDKRFFCYDMKVKSKKEDGKHIGFVYFIHDFSSLKRNREKA